MQIHGLTLMATDIIRSTLNDGTNYLAVHLMIEIDDGVRKDPARQDITVVLNYDEDRTLADLRRDAFKEARKMFSALASLQVEDMEQHYQTSMLPLWERDEAPEGADR